MREMQSTDTDNVRAFWDANPLCATSIPFPLGSEEYFKYYDGLRETIENVEFSYELHEYKEFEGKKVLDVGSGNGYVLSKYAKEGASVYGVDITPTGIQLCRSRFGYLGIQGNFQVADAQHLPFENNTFDCVTSMGVLHHVPVTERAVSEIFRVLKPGGRLIVMFYHRNSALYRVRYPLVSILTGKSRQQLVNEFDGVGNPKGDVYSRVELAQLLSDFVGIEMSVGFLTGEMVFPKVGRYIPEAIIHPFEKLFGWNLYAKAWKPE